MSGDETPGHPDSAAGIRLVRKHASGQKKAKSLEELLKSGEISRLMIEASSDCIKLLDLEGRLLYMNPGGQRLLEISDIRKMIGAALAGFFQGAGREAASNAVQAAAAGTVGKFIGYAPTMKGSPKWWDVSVGPVFDANQNVVALLSISRDITEHRRALDALRESEEHHRLISELTSDFVATLRLEPEGELRAEAVSDGFTKTTGFTPPEIRERGGWRSLVHPGDAAKVIAAIERLAAGERVDGDVRVITRGGEARSLRFVARPVGLKEGKMRVLAAFEDVTERRRAEETMRRHEEAIRQLSTPVLPVRDRLLILPIIGAVDEARARRLTDELLGAIRAHRAKVVVVDITGVPGMDASVANRLIFTIDAARLLGARVIVTGISRRISLTLVEGGVDLRKLTAIGDLRGGIEEAERELGYEVVKQGSQPPAAEKKPGQGAGSTGDATGEPAQADDNRELLEQPFPDFTR